MPSFDYGSGMPSDVQLPVAQRPGSNVAMGPFSFPKSMGLSLTSAPFRPAAQVVGSPNNQTRLDAAQLGPDVFKTIEDNLAAKKKAAEDAKALAKLQAMMAQRTYWQAGMGGNPNSRGSLSDRGGYTTSGREGAGSFGSRSSSASRSDYGGGGLY